MPDDFVLSDDASRALAELCSLMVRKHNKKFTIGSAIIQCVEDLKSEEEEAERDVWAVLVAEYVNLDETVSPEGGRLQHRPCGEIVTRAVLNRENLELMMAHMDTCKAKNG